MNATDAKELADLATQQNREIEVLADKLEHHASESAAPESGAALEKSMASSSNASLTFARMPDSRIGSQRITSILEGLSGDAVRPRLGPETEATPRTAPCRAAT